MKKKITFLCITAALNLMIFPHTVLAAEEMDEDYSSAILQAIEDTKNYSWGNGSGSLYDVDGNGVEELIMVYTAKIEEEDYAYPAKVCSVYTISDGKVIQLINKEILFSEVGGPSGHVSVIKKGRDKYFAIAAETGETGGYPGCSINRYGSWKLYTIKDASLELNMEVDYNYYREDEILYDESTASVNGEECSYLEYEEWRDQLEEVFVIETFIGENTTTLDELLDDVTGYSFDTLPEVLEE